MSGNESKGQLAKRLAKENEELRLAIGGGASVYTEAEMRGELALAEIRHTEKTIKHWEDNVFPYLDAAIELAWQMGDCRGMVRANTNADILRRYLTDRDVTIGVWATKLRRGAIGGAVSNLGEVALIVDLCTEWQVAIGIFIKTGNRDQLDRLANDGDTMRDALRAINIKRGGREDGNQSDYTEDIKKRVCAYLETHPTHSDKPYKVYQGVMDMYLEMAKDGTLRGASVTALAKMQAWKSRDKNIKRFIRACIETGGNLTG